MRKTRPQVCESVRAFASLELDGELPELEQAVLSAHVAECAGCRSERAELAAATAAVRAAPAERPGRRLWPALSRRSAPIPRVRIAAAAVACLVALAALGTPGGRDDTPRRIVPREYLTQAQIEREVTLILLTSPGEPMPSPPGGPSGSARLGPPLY